MVFTEGSSELNGQLVTPEQLRSDNASPWTREILRRYDDAKNAGELVGITTCSDARVNWSAYLNTPEINTYPSIAAGGSKEPWVLSLKHSGVGSIIVSQHHDGTNGTPLTGCGGLAVKLQRRETGEHDKVTAGVLGYVDHDITSHEVYTQAILQALAIAELTDKPILTVTVDHITGQVYPLAVIRDGGKQITTSVPPQYWRDPEYIYRTGSLPVLETKDLPENFQRLMRWNGVQVKNLPRDNAGFEKKQRVQDPQAVILSTSVIPASLRYPDTFGKPNTHFGVRLPFSKNGIQPGQIQIEQEQLNRAIAQAEYPISHSAHAKPGESFYGTHILLVETKSMELSRQIAQEVVQFPWFQEWQDKRADNQIWVAQVQKGMTQNMEVFR